MPHAFMIAAPSSNSGKTTFTLALMQALQDKGLTVQPFKCGPDYIDPMHHRAVTGHDSYNLDLWMGGHAHVQTVFARQASAAQASVVEGVMGLFDGAEKDHGSSAHVAKCLQLPVVLVVDGSAMAYSAAPLLHGYKCFDPEVRLVGAVFNKVSGPSHYRYLHDAAIDANVEPLGYVGKQAGMAMSSRHLGLTMPHEQSMDWVHAMASGITATVQIDRLLALCQYQSRQPFPPISRQPGKLTFAVARDDAFNFIYPANIDALKAWGNVEFFSPLQDTRLPPAQLVWLPGGYPELYAGQLSQNQAMRQAIARHVADNGALVAECGGFIYLGKTLTTATGTYPMAGILPHDTSFGPMKPTLGYREVAIGEHVFRGHEFHYSHATNSISSNNVTIFNARGQTMPTPVSVFRRSLASYMHLYCGDVGKMGELLELLGVHAVDSG
ncbi:MAG: cobyrinate a,c-diamide synthase [Breznakibacter sp.]